MRRFWWCALAACVASGDGTASPMVFEGAVTTADDLAPFFEAAATRRVDVVGIGDSNQLFGGHGWDDGWILALDDRFGAFATSLLSIGENNGNAANAGSGYRMYSSASSGAFDYDGAPAEAEMYLYPADGFIPMDYVYVPEGESRQITNHGLAVSPGGPVNTSAALTFSTIYAEFPVANGGYFQPFIRNAGPPYSTVAQAPGVNTAGPVYAAVRHELHLPEASRPFSLQCMTRRFAANIAGPFLGYYMRVIETDTDRGAVFGTLYGNGGKSARDMARTFLDLPDETLTLYFGTLRDDQGADPQILIRINTGLNDRNENLPPIGIVAAPDSPEAFEQHLNLIIDRIIAVWTANGWPQDELYFCLSTSHPFGDSEFDDDPELLAYRERAATIAQQRPRCVAVDYLAITDDAELASLGWYATPSDRNHLKLAAYRGLSVRELAALQNGRSWFDADDDGRVAPEDLYALDQATAPPADAPDDLSREGLEAAVRFGEREGALSARD